MLALNIQTLFYKIGASNLEFKQRVDESKGKLHEFERKTQDNIRILRNWSAAAGAAATGLVYALNRTVQSTNTTAETVAKLSEQTGVAVENMQGLGYAARQNKSSMEELGQSMVRMTRRTQEAAQGNQSYVASYERIGVSFRNVDGSIKSTETLLLDLADAFAASTDENLKTQVAFNLLGDSGYNLIPLLNQGRDEIIRLAEEANRLGTVLSRENIEKFARYDNVMVKFREGMAGVKTQLATAVVPVFTLLGKKANEGLEKFMDWVRENPKLVAQGVVLGGVLTTLGLALGAVALGMTIVGKGAVLVKGLFGLLTNPILWLIALAFLLYTAWDENWGGVQEKTKVAVDFVLLQLNKLLKWLGWEDLPERFRELWAGLNEVWTNEQLTFSQKVSESTELVIDFVFGEGTTQSIRKYWVDLVTIWTDTEKPVIQKFSETFKITMKFILGEQTVENIEIYWDTIKKIWGDTETSFLEKLQLTWDATKILLGIELKPEGEVYDALKEGAENGEWEKFWKIVSDVWSGIAVVLLTLQLTTGAVKGILMAIGAFFGNNSGTLGVGGIPLAIGIVTLGIQLKEALEKGSFGDFAKNVLVAALTAAIGGAFFGPGGALLGFNLALNFKLGEVVAEGIEETAHSMGEKAGIPRDHWAKLQAYEEYRQAMVAEATKGMNSLQKLWWQILGNQPDGLLSFDEWGEQSWEPLASPKSLEGGVRTLDDLLNAIRRAEGGDEAEILYGMTSFKDRDVSYFSDTDQSRWEELSQGLERGTDEYWRAAAQTTVESYWRHFQNKFPEVAGQNFDEVTPEMQQIFITYLGAWFSPPSAHELNINWVPNVLEFMDFDELSQGFRTGFGSVLDAMEQAVYEKAADHETAADFLAKIYADRLMGQSPPPKGPLSKIDEGGYNTMTAWVEGAEQGLNDGLPLITRVLNNVKKLFSALGDSTMDWLRGQFPELMTEFDGLFEKAELDYERLMALIEGITSGTNKAQEATKQWTDSLVQGLSNAIGYGRGLEETFDSVLGVFDSFLGMLASQFLQTQVFAPLFSKIGFEDFLAGLPIFHEGGLILSPAAYYHSGGYIGELKSDEVPIIAQTGERVLSRQQNDQFESLLQNVSTDGAGAQHIEVNINAVDAASFQELLMRNSDGVKHLIIDDVGRNGPLRKILLQLARS